MRSTILPRFRGICVKIGMLTDMTLQLERTMLLS
jgi:hypothetical protein